MSKHVPGPYEVLPLEGKYYGTVIRIGKHTFSVWAVNYEDFAPSRREIDRGWEPEHGWDHVEDERSYHTALLIAAAPDLLAACKVMREFIRDNTKSGWVDPSCVLLADAAIAKTEGGAH